MLGQTKKANFSKFQNIFKPDIDIKLKNNINMDLTELYNVNNKTNKPFNIGGDHSLSIASVSSSIHKYGPDIKIIWFDAHPDLNSYKSSPTKNLHGMVLNYFTKFGKTNPDFKFVPRITLNPENIMYVGIRDIDPFEQEMIRKSNIKVLTSDTVNNYPNIALHDFTTFIGKDKFHLSFDVDALDSSLTPSTGTPVAKGLLLNPTINLIKSLNKDNMIACDLVEFNPSIGNKQEVLKTQYNVLKIFDALTL